VPIRKSDNGNRHKIILVLATLLFGDFKPKIESIKPATKIGTPITGKM
jgi:hypothetical protein